MLYPRFLFIPPISPSTWKMSQAKNGRPQPLPNLTSDTSLNDHLRKCSPIPPNPRLILGNEAADMDSVVCALVLSYAIGQTSLPIINIKRSEFPLRRDISLAFDLIGIDKSLLHFIDDDAVRAVLETPSSIILVDHNELANHQTGLSPRVAGVIDHHKDDDLFHSATPRIIEKVGSCATLIAEHVSSLLSDASRPLLPAVATLLLCAILLDCHNMDVSVGKSTPRDEVMLHKLLDASGMSEADKNNLFENLFAARKDITGLTAADLLHKDAKFVSSENLKIAITSIGVSIDNLVQRAPNGLCATAKDAATNWKVDCIVIMTAFSKNGIFIRELLVQCNPLGDYIFNQLENDQSGLGLVSLHQEIDGFHFAVQNNTKASRKIVLPLIKQNILNYKSSNAIESDVHP